MENHCFYQITDANYLDLLADDEIIEVFHNINVTKKQHGGSVRKNNGQRLPLHGTHPVLSGQPEKRPLCFDQVFIEVLLHNCIV